MRKQFWLLLSLLFFAFLPDATAQVKVVNEGILTIKDDQLVYINGNFSNYAALLLNDGDFRLTGNLLNEVGVPNPGNGIFRFIGFDEQQLTLYDTLRMYNVEINNPSGINFDGVSHLQVFGNLNFTEGLAYTNEDAMFHFKNNASTTNGNSFSYIDGPALKSGFSDFIFPVGKQGFYRPAAISELSATGVFQMEYFHETYFNEIKEEAILKVNEEGYWDIKSFASSSFPKLTLNYDAASNMFSETEYIDIVHWTDKWGVIPAQSDGASPSLGIITEERLSDFGFYTTAERRKFNPNYVTTTVTQNEDCSIRIDWVMAEGTVVANYEIEFSYDSLEFKYLGSVPGSFEALPAYTNYYFIDESLHAESKIYYRIKMIPPGVSSYFTYSFVSSIENKCIFEDCLLYPNPVSSGSNINFQVSSAVNMNMPLEIWDALGRLIFTQVLPLEIGPHIYEIQTRELHLPSATYFLKVSPTKILKFIVIND